MFQGELPGVCMSFLLNPLSYLCPPQLRWDLNRRLGVLLVGTPGWPALSSLPVRQRLAGLALQVCGVLAVLTVSTPFFYNSLRQLSSDRNVSVSYNPVFLTL